jgi:hypothetical protein
MKIKQSLMVGILFLVVFVGAMLFAMAIGKWNPAGIGETHHEGEEHEGEESKLPELHGEMNLQEWCAVNKIPADCVADKLGLTVEQLNQPARDIASSIGRQTYELVVMFEECFKMGSKPDYEEKTEKAEITELHGYMNFKEWLIKSGISLECTSEKLGIPVSEFDSEARGVLEPKGFEPPTMADVLKDCIGKTEEVKHEEKSNEAEKTKEEHSEKPQENEPVETMQESAFLKGSDNVLEYLKTNKINIECVARTLGLTENDLDKTAKEVAALVGQEHIDYIREVIANCK